MLRMAKFKANNTRTPSSHSAHAQHTQNVPLVQADIRCFLTNSDNGLCSVTVVSSHRACVQDDHDVQLGEAVVCQTVSSLADALQSSCSLADPKRITDFPGFSHRKGHRSDALSKDDMFVEAT